MDRKTKQVLLFAVALLPSSFAHADGGQGVPCTDAQKRDAEAHFTRAENAERAGRVKEAHDLVRSVRDIDCAKNGPQRQLAQIRRTSKKLGDDAEKAGRYGEAFEYYRTRQGYPNDENLLDADRALLKQAKASPDSYKVVSFAEGWFSHRRNEASVREIRAIAKASGARALATEDKAFAARRVSLDELEKAREWLALAGDAKPVFARAVQRGDTLLATGAFSSVERAFQYYSFARDKQKLKSAEARARQLGDQHAKDGQTRIAAQFYELAGDSAKAAALQKKSEARNEKAEAKRQEQFQKDQKSLEKELGL